MQFELSDRILSYLEASQEETIALIEALCRIPAPSGHEEKRAEFCKNWLLAQGAKDVIVDEALNVLYPIGCEGKDDIVLFMAHTDTVFPDMEPMPFTKDGDDMYSPGVGDDTACLAVILMIAKYIAQNNLIAPCGIMFAANAAEEGLGNLKGIRQIMKDYAGRIKEVYTFDSQYNSFVNRCVGSRRYEVTFATEGGHSYGAFGNRNAIYAMADLICRLYDCEIPVCGDSKTTYNVGIVEGGTSVNTIAQHATLLYEYRSNSEECLERMKAFFESEIENAKQAGKAEIAVKLVGDRPCGGKVDEAHLEAMSRKVETISQKHSGMPCVRRSGSTDANIPMSLGVPAVSVGSYLGSGAHTREEKVQISSIPVGLKIAAELILGYFA